MEKKYRKFFYLFFINTLFVNAQNSEEQFWKNKFYTPSGFGVHSDLAYGAYLVEVASSEMNSAIDYSVLEATLGVSYVYGSWMWGGYGKFLVDEVTSNMYVVNTDKKLTNQAQIDKKEFAFYINYTLVQKKQSSWRFNLIYKESLLDAKNSYHAFNDYQSYFYYQTKGLALSLVYADKLNKKHGYFISSGLLQSRVKVSISETVNTIKQDAFIESDSSAIGLKMAFGYNYILSSHLILSFRSDAWWLKFSKLKVNSEVGDSLPKATLKEQTIGSYMGLTWHF